jgi:glutamate-ammonia-ligase adenylyltransferase
LRRAWYRLVIKIGYSDMSVVSPPSSVGAASQSSFNKLRMIDHLRLINRTQTALAEAALRIAVEIALEATGIAAAQRRKLPFAILGLGRLGHAGMDYGSDLDLLVVFDDEEPCLSPAASPRLGVHNTAQEFYTDFTSHLVRTLSSITREGLLYRSDLRLRPEGKSGRVAVGLSRLVAYITNRASAWEHSAYLKSREVAGDLEFGQRAQRAICDAIFDAAARNESAREELRDVRAKLEKEKARGSRPNIKWGRGGMTDVYFVTRYLQLRGRIYIPPEHGTAALIRELGKVGALDADATGILVEGYWFLRSLDHWMRLLSGRPRPVLPASTAAMRDISRALGLASVEELERAVAHHTSAVRGVYDRVFG